MIETREKESRKLENEIDASTKKPLIQQLGWLVLIWASGVISLIAFAQLIRYLMGLVGLTTP